MATYLMEDLPAGLGLPVSSNLSEGETVEIQIKGCFKEVLVCTDRRVMIFKSGFMTGNTFGSNVFQVPYRSITGCEVKKGFASSWFEISTGGMQNTPKKNFSTDRKETVRDAPNAISLREQWMVEKFKKATSHILGHLHVDSGATAQPPAAIANDIALTLERLWKLKGEGALTQEEYDHAKHKLLNL